MPAKIQSSENGVKKGSVKTRPKPKPAFSNNDNYALRDLFIDELKMLYWSEKTLAKSLKKIETSCHSSGLKQTIGDHILETEAHIERLERAFSEMGSKPVSRKCEAMAGLISEEEMVINGIAEGAVKDAAIIMATQKIEHYEIATYGTLCVFSKILNEGKITTLFKETLAEEKNADESLSGIAERHINMEALIEREWE